MKKDHIVIALYVYLTGFIFIVCSILIFCWSMPQYKDKCELEYLRKYYLASEEMYDSIIAKDSTAFWNENGCEIIHYENLLDNIYGNKRK